jgi:single-strand DNA-binding protein
MKVNGLVRLVRDGELKYTTTGTALLSLTVAYDLGFGDKKKSNFVDCVVWGKQGEALSKYLVKGSQISIESGDLEIQTWEKDGQKRSKPVVNIRDLKFAGSKGSTQQSNNDTKSDPFEDDIPF